MKTTAVINHIVNWLSDYLKKTGLNGFITGVSGGVDSAVTSTLCARTGAPVIALTMPIHQAEDQVSRADDHIAWLSRKYPEVQSSRVDLTPSFEQIKSSLPQALHDDLTLANTRSRLRMLTLYAHASAHRMLVAGTGNKVEDFGVGFFTKYGDGGVDLSPIADLLKSQVYKLAEAMGVIESIRTAAPTDGLWADNRTDESQIGATYAELEWAMQTLESGPTRPLTDRQKTVMAIYEKFHSTNRHKMDPIPVCRIPGDFLAD